MLRRFLPLTAALFLIATFALAACGDDDDGGEATPPPASETEDNGDDRPGNGNGDEPTTTPGGEETATPKPTPVTVGDISGEFDTAWYEFRLTHELLDDRDALAIVAAEASGASGIDDEIIRTQAGRHANRAFDGLVMVFLDPADELGLPLMDIRWCLPSVESPGNTTLMTLDLEDRGATVEDAGTVSHDGAEYPLLKYNLDVQPDLDFYIAHVQDGDCWVEVMLTARADAEPPLDAVRDFIATIAVGDS